MRRTRIVSKEGREDVSVGLDTMDGVGKGATEGLAREQQFLEITCRRHPVYHIDTCVEVRLL